MSQRNTRPVRKVILALALLTMVIGIFAYTLGYTQGDRLKYAPLANLSLHLLLLVVLLNASLDMLKEPLRRKTLFVVLSIIFGTINIALLIIDLHELIKL